MVEDPFNWRFVPLLDWYIDYRIDKKDRKNKNRRYFGKDKRP